MCINKTGTACLLHGSGYVKTECYEKTGMGLLAMVLLAACSDDKSGSDTGTTAGKNLVSPRVRAAEAGTPYTGFLDVYPLKAGTTNYFGIYRGDPPVQTSFCGIYSIVDGEIEPGKGMPVLLPLGTYDMLYWAYTPPSDTTISYPRNSGPVLRLGTDMALQSYGLVSYFGMDTVYYSVDNLAFASQPVKIGAADLSADLTHAVAALRVNLSNDDGTPFDESIDSIQIYVGTVAERINLVTAEPSDMTRTVLVPLRFSPSRMVAYNTVLVFPSGPNPWAIIEMTLNTGEKKTYTDKLSNVLRAGRVLGLTVKIGEILATPEQGNGFRVHDWTESDETINTGPIQ